jgi:hypothetical protein
MKLTTLKILDLKFNRDLNRLATLTNLEVLTLHITPQAKLRIEDIADLLTLPNLEELDLTTPLPKKELREMFSANRKLISLKIKKIIN